MTHLARIALAALALVACNGGGGSDTGGGTRTDAILALSGDPTAGKTVYDGTCSACHGASGEGGVGLPLTTSTKTDAEMVDIILNGGVTMAAYGDQYDDQQIADCLAYIRTL